MSAGARRRTRLLGRALAVLHRMCSTRGGRAQRAHRYVRRKRAPYRLSSDRSRASTAQHSSTAQHTVTVGTHPSRFRTSHRNVGVKISPVPAPYFTKNGCAPSVTSWGDYLARLFHNKSQSPLSDTPPYTEETPLRLRPVSKSAGCCLLLKSSCGGDRWAIQYHLGSSSDDYM